MTLSYTKVDRNAFCPQNCMVHDLKTASTDWKEDFNCSRGLREKKRESEGERERACETTEKILNKDTHKNKHTHRQACQDTLHPDTNPNVLL